MQRVISLLAVTLSCSAACSSSEDPSSGTGGAPATTGGAPSGGTVSAGSGGAAAGSAGTAGSALPSDVPADTSKAGIAAFLASKAYESWKFDVPEPRDSEGLPTHGRVRVAINPTLDASIAAGANGEKAPFAAGSMAVKELYGTGDTVLGLGFMLKVAPENAIGSWVYYCDGPADLCGLADEPVPFYSAGSSVSACTFCHGNYFFIGTR